MVPTINCSGTPFEIGYMHGSLTAAKIQICIKFYTALFKERCGLSWAQARQNALQYDPFINRTFPDYEAEMRGIAKGAKVDYEDVLALNVRTELVFGTFMDGCTALSWKTKEINVVAQNWDWMEEQKECLILLNIKQRNKPSISMMTEAGMIGKIGLNSAGLALCVNAIKSAGTDPNKIPIHLAWRHVLDNVSVSAAVAAIERYGCAAAAHMFIVDRNQAIGLEVTHRSIKKLQPDAQGRIFHTNHMLLKHPGVTKMWLGDTLDRLARIKVIADELGSNPSAEQVGGLMKDERDFPCAINRAQEGESDAATVFTITTDVTNTRAVVTVGRPSSPEQTLVLDPRVWAGKESRL